MYCYILLMLLLQCIWGQPTTDQEGVTVHCTDDTCVVPLSIIKGHLQGIQSKFGLAGSSAAVQGEKGEKGLPGIPGQSGFPGMKGDVGIPGLNGQKGTKGGYGEPGERGERGLKGDPGLSSRGFPGIKGDHGYTGIPGERGVTGLDGRPGFPGAKGDPGQFIVGSKGEAGQNGLNGAKGMKGEPGSQGSSGIQGPPGPPGISSTDTPVSRDQMVGRPGVPGIKGSTGSSGEVGPPGRPGFKGDLGLPGIKGDSGFPGVKGRIGEAGLTGLSGEIGLPGMKGEPGSSCVCDVNNNAVYGENITGSSGELMSPLYPENYPPNTQATWLITVGTSHVVRVTIVTMDMTIQRGCTSSYVKFLDVSRGSKLAQVCGVHVPNTFQTSGNILAIEFKSNQFNDGSQGFLLNWEAVDPGSRPSIVSMATTLQPSTQPYEECGGSLSAERYKKTFVSPGYPRLYGNRLNCRWTIHSPKGAIIWLNITNIDVEGCCDKIYVYEGNFRGRLLGTYISKNSITSTTNIVAIKFTSDGSVTKPGFVIDYEIESSGCGFERDICGWSQSTVDDIDWEHHNGSTPSLDTGPLSSYDGYYLYVEASNNPRRKAQLISDPLARNPYCLKLMYHMYGEGMGSLRIRIKQNNRVIATKSGNQGEVWRLWTIRVKTSVLPTNGNFNFVIEATVGADYRSDIAIDDVNIMLGDC